MRRGDLEERLASAILALERGGVRTLVTLHLRDLLAAVARPGSER